MTILTLTSACLPNVCTAEKKYNRRLAVFFAKIPPSSHNQGLIIAIFPLSLYTILQRWSPLRNKNAWDARSLVNLAPLSHLMWRRDRERERERKRKEGRKATPYRDVCLMASRCRFKSRRDGWDSRSSNGSLLACKDTEYHSTIVQSQSSRHSSIVPTLFSKNF